VAKSSRICLLATAFQPDFEFCEGLSYRAGGRERNRGSVVKRITKLPTMNDESFDTQQQIQYTVLILLIIVYMLRPHLNQVNFK